MKHSTCVLISIFSVLINAPPLQAIAGENDQLEKGEFGIAITDESLATNRGGHNQELNTNTLDAKFYNNQATGNVTGSNFVTAGAFSGTSGFATVIQNSGNNVLIQNATILNVKLQ